MLASWDLQRGNRRFYKIDAERGRSRRTPLIYVHLYISNRACLDFTKVRHHLQ